VASALPLTLAQAVEQFLQEEQALGRSPETLDWHKLGLKQLQAYLSRRRFSLLNSVTETEMRGWLAFLRAEPSATGTIRTANTVMTAARSAHAFCAWAVRQGYLERTPFARGMVPWYRNRQSNWQSIQLIEPEIFTRLLHACRPPGSKGENEDHATARNRAMLWMMLEMGLLVSEVCALRVGDVDERFQTLHIQGPGARERQLPLAENTRRTLRAYLMHQRMRMGKHGEHDPLFLSERCKPMTPNLVTQLFHRLSLRAGITEQWITPSMLHDTFAVQYLQAGGNLRALQEHLGLEDAVSVKRYEHFCKHSRPQL
jgi:site-specific recombinase XerD